MRRFLPLLVGLVWMTACRTETVVSGSEETTDMVGTEGPQGQEQVRIAFICEHDRGLFNAPVAGGYADALLDWGDGTDVPLLPGERHDYGTLDGEAVHTLRVTGRGTGSLSVPRMTGVRHITVRRSGVPDGQGGFMP